MKPPVKLDTSSFWNIQLHKMASDIEDELTHLLWNYCLWYPDTQILEDLIEGNSIKYIEEFRAKRLSDTHSEWYYDIGSQRDEADVEAFFDRFKRMYASPLLNHLAKQCRVIHYRDQEGYSSFQVNPPAFVYN